MVMQKFFKVIPLNRACGEFFENFITNWLFML